MKGNRQQLYLPLPYRSRLHAESAATGRGISEIVRRALDVYWEGEGIAVKRAKRGLAGRNRGEGRGG